VTTFFTDENLSPKCARLLDVFDGQNQVRAHSDWFEQGTPDTAWIPEVAGWDPKPVVVCGDARILRNKVERSCLADSGLTWVFLGKGWTQLNWPDFAWKIIKCWPQVVRDVERARQPTVFEVSCGTMKVERRGLTATKG